MKCIVFIFEYFLYLKMFIKGLIVIFWMFFWNNGLGVFLYLFLKEYKILIKLNR